MIKLHPILNPIQIPDDNEWISFAGDRGTPFGGINDIHASAKTCDELIKIMEESNLDWCQIVERRSLKMVKDGYNVSGTSNNTDIKWIWIDR